MFTSFFFPLSSWQINLQGNRKRFVQVLVWKKAMIPGQAFYLLNGTPTQQLNDTLQMLLRLSIGHCLLFPFTQGMDWLGHGCMNIYRHNHLLGIVRSQPQPMPGICKMPKYMPNLDMTLKIDWQISQWCYTHTQEEWNHWFMCLFTVSVVNLS